MRYSDRLILCALLILLIAFFEASCAVNTVTSVYPQGRSERCSNVFDSRTSCGDELYHYQIVAPGADFWTKRGIVGGPISAESGERLEVWWTGFFPHYELRYYGEDSNRGLSIGRCHFAQGCNRAFFFAPDVNNNGVPDAFSRIVWESIDCHHDGGYPGYLDRYRYIYRPPVDACVLYYDLLYYEYEPSSALCSGTCRPSYWAEKDNGEKDPGIFRRKIIPIN